MLPTEYLQEEHRAIQHMLRVLDAVCRKLESHTPVEAAHLTAMLDFFSQFADLCHHGKEEQVLFVEMVKAGFPSDNGPIGVMLFEHDMGRLYLANMRRELPPLLKGDLSSAPAFVEEAQAYLNLMGDHIQKEDSVLYPMANLHIPAYEQKDWMDHFREVNQQTVGQDKRAEYMELPEKLGRIYLNG